MIRNTEKLDASLESTALRLVSHALVGIANKRPDYLLRAFEPILTKLPAGFYCTDIATHQIIYANQTFLNIVGYESLQALNDGIKIGKLFENSEARAKWLEELKMGDKIQQHRFTLSKHQTNGDSIPIHVEDTSFIIRDPKSHKPKYAVGFIQDTTERVKMENELKDKVYLDALTRLHNKRYYEEKLETHIDQWRIDGKPVSIIMIDIDYFKRWNDEFNHSYGDSVLRKLGLQILTHLKENDIPIRYGGEEILIALPIDVDVAKKVAERLRVIVDSLGKFPGKDTLNDGKTLTISLGVASGTGTLKELTDQADAALYTSKHRGKNQVTVYEEGMKIKEK